MALRWKCNNFCGCPGSQPSCFSCPNRWCHMCWYCRIKHMFLYINHVLIHLYTCFIIYLKNKISYGMKLFAYKPVIQYFCHNKHCRGGVLKSFYHNAQMLNLFLPLMRGMSMSIIPTFTMKDKYNAWCKIIVTTLFYVKNQNSFAPRSRNRVLPNCM